MRRPGTMSLALMGGGAAALALGGFALFGGGRETEACRVARLENRPDVAAACAQRSGRSGSGSFIGGSSSDGSGASSASRGGFGAAGASAGS